ncbi:MAG: D-inositol-3-phosphate glycosyltransferase [Chlamydiia bacterium]|nr:D-inositol-3-phosphate glycosyltransferase [Chlamydiia bacterium]
MKTVIVHDWLYSISGAEKVVESIYKLFPSKIYTLIKNSKFCKSRVIQDDDVQCSFIQKLPFGKTKYPYYLPLFPLAIENLDVSNADVVISSSSCVAKGVLTDSSQLHICYCHTPARFAWDMYFDYLKMNRLEKGALGLIMRVVIHNLRNWDLLHSQRVDHYIANSKYVANRIRSLYRRDSEVIYPPVDVDFYSSNQSSTSEEYYIAAGRCVSYKRMDLIVEAFSKKRDRKLVVVGTGPELKKLKSIASSNVEFTGYIENELLRTMLSNAKALIYAAKEDFGILPVEAQAAGLPVIGFGYGGLCETVIENKTGVYFNNQSVDSLLSAIKRFELLEDKFDRSFISKHSKQFSKANFEMNFKSFINAKYQVFVDKERS